MSHEIVPLEETEPAFPTLVPSSWVTQKRLAAQLGHVERDLDPLAEERKALTLRAVQLGEIAENLEFRAKDARWMGFVWGMAFMGTLWFVWSRFFL